MTSHLTDLGLGLDHAGMGLAVTSVAWVEAGAALVARTADVLGTLAVEVEQVGSSSVVGLLAKPILDVAVGVARGAELAPVRAALDTEGWIYRGDAGSEGGHVFVLESRPWHRVAHLHVVEHGGREWVDYLRLRDLLRADPDACRRYGEEKRRLAALHPDDRQAYTRDKTPIVTQLLSEVP